MYNKIANEIKGIFSKEEIVKVCVTERHDIHCTEDGEEIVPSLGLFGIENTENGWKKTEGEWKEVSALDFTFEEEKASFYNYNEEVVKSIILESLREATSSKEVLLKQDEDFKFINISTYYSGREWITFPNSLTIEINDHKWSLIFE